MKFIKYAVGLVIALSVIPMGVVAVNKLDDPVLRTIEFEVVDYVKIVDAIRFSETIFNDIHSLMIYDSTNNVSNLISVRVNDIELTYISLSYNPNDNYYNFNRDNGDYGWKTLNVTNAAKAVTYTPTIGDKWTMTFEVPNPTPPLIKLLVGFAPLLFVGGVLLFMLNKRKFE